MARRLQTLKTCAVCADRFRPFHLDQLTCSRSCRSIRAARLKPQHFQMVAANRAKQAQFDAKLAQALEGLTLVEAYKRGHVRGTLTTHQRITRKLRKVA